MASLELDPASGRYRVRFRYGGQEFKRSLRTKSRRVADASLGQVEEVLRMLEIGLTELPAGVDEGNPRLVQAAAIEAVTAMSQATPHITKALLGIACSDDLPLGSTDIHLA